jgi:hypothetical protein
MNHHSAYYLGVKQISNAGFLSQRAIASVVLPHDGRSFDQASHGIMPKA